MFVPQATVYEHHRPVFRKDEIRATGQISNVKPIPITLGEQSLADYAFRLRVFPADARHAVAALLGCEYIGHNSCPLLIRYFFNSDE
jgi:hypothetical protein